MFGKFGRMFVWSMLSQSATVICSDCYHCQCVSHSNITVAEYIGVSPHMNKNVKPKNSSLGDNLLFCNHLTTFDDCSNLISENKKVFTRIENKSGNNERSTFFEIGTLHRHHYIYWKGPKDLC